MEKELLSKPEYEKHIAATRDARMAWFREARFGMFVHYGLYTLLGRNEWVQAVENIPISEYEKLAERFERNPDFHYCSYYPQLSGGMDWAGGARM